MVVFGRTQDAPSVESCSKATVCLIRRLISLLDSVQTRYGRRGCECCHGRVLSAQVAFALSSVPYTTTPRFLTRGVSDRVCLLCSGVPMPLPDDVLCMILRQLPLSRQKAGLALVCTQWARCLAMADSYREAIGYVNGKVALRQTLRGVRPGVVSLDELHRNTVEAEVYCTGVTFINPLLSLVKLVLTLNSHDEYIKLPAATAEIFPQLEELHLDNKGDLNSTDHALEWDLRSMPALKQVACDSLNNTFEWDLHQLPKLQRVFCGSTRMPRLHLPLDCNADLELQLFMQQAALDLENSSGLKPWSCIRSLHLDRCASLYPPYSSLCCKFTYRFAVLTRCCAGYG